VEDMAQMTVDPKGRPVTRQKLFDELKELEQEECHLRTHYLRRDSSLRKRAKGQQLIPAPEGYASYSDFQLHRIIDFAFNYDVQHGMTGMPSWHDRYFAMVGELRVKLDQLRTYAARRTGDPYQQRRQNRGQWCEWAGGNRLPQSVGLIREWARGRFENGMMYEQTLWEVAGQVMMYSGEQLDRRRADAIKKAVDREYKERFSDSAPKPPRGWWRSSQYAWSVTPGGLKTLGLAWKPPRDYPFIRHWDLSPQAGDHPWFDKPPVG